MHTSPWLNVLVVTSLLLAFVPGPVRAALPRKVHSVSLDEAKAQSTTRTELLAAKPATARETSPSEAAVGPPAAKGETEAMVLAEGGSMYYLDDTAHEVHLVHPQGESWAAGCFEAEAEAYVVAVVFRVKKTGDCPILKRMEADDSCWGDQLFEDTSDSLNDGGYYCSHDKYEGGACQAVAPSAATLVQNTVPTNTTTVRGGFQLGHNCEGEAEIYDIRLVYFDVPPTLPDDQDLAPGECPFCNSSGHTNSVGGPINTRTGNYHYSEQDFSIPVLGGPLRFERSYNSQVVSGTVVYSRPLGYGWTHNLNMGLVFSGTLGGEADTVIVKSYRGSRLRFEDDGNETYEAYPGVWATLTRTVETSPTYFLQGVDQSTYVFTSTGQLAEIRDPQGHTVTLTYSGTLLTRVEDVTGERFLAFTYDNAGRLVEARDPISRTVQYGYDDSDDLIAITDTLGLVSTYTYTDTHLLWDVRDPADHVVERTEYDDQGRAVRQWDGMLGDPLSIDYGLDGSTTITDPLGHVTVDYYDARGMLTSQALTMQGSGAVTTTSRVYDAGFNWASHADANGNTTGYTVNQMGQTEMIVDAQGGATWRDHDELNHLTAVTDALSHATHYEYEGNRLITTTDALSGTVVNTYDARGLLIQIVNRGVTTTYEYDDFGQQTAITDVLGNVTTYQYDGVGRLVTTTNPAGQVTVSAYDDGDNLVQVTRNYTTAGGGEQNYLEMYNLVTGYGYDDAGNHVAMTNTLGFVTRYRHDDVGRLISTTTNYSPTVGPNYDDQWNVTTRYGYDAVGNQTHVTNTLGYVTRTWYDEANRLISTTANYSPTVGPNYNGQWNVTTRYGYDAVGNRTHVTDTLSHVTLTGYDELNRGITVTVNYSTAQRADTNITTTYGYDAVGNAITVTDTAGRVTRNWYDALNRSVTVTTNYEDGVYNAAHPDQDLTSLTTYDDAGRVSARVQLSGTLRVTTTYAYDALGRLVTTTNALSGTSVTHYDALGRSTETIDAEGHSTHYAYDAIGRLVTTTNALSGISVTHYDVLGRRTETIDARGNVTRHDYDALGRVVVVTDPLTGTIRYAYDALGRRTVVTDASGVAVYSTYDALGRLVATTDALDNSTGLVYDVLGHKVATTDANAIATHYGYDGLGRLITVTENYSATGPSDHQTNLYTEYAYDRLGNMVVVTDVLTYTTVYTYDLAGRLVAQADALGHVTAYAYDGLGRPTAAVYADATGSITVTTLYNLLSWPTQVSYPAVGDASGFTVEYAYDQVGHRTAMTDAVGTTTYVYDDLYQPLTVTSPVTGTVGYRYDAAGNRTKLIYPGGEVVTYTYDAANRLTEVEDWDGGETVYAYDGAGRVLTVTLPNDVQTTMDYDGAGRPVEIEHRDASGGLLAWYQYELDGVGNRVVVTETVLEPSAGHTAALPELDRFFAQNVLPNEDAAGQSAPESLIPGVFLPTKLLDFRKWSPFNIWSPAEDQKTEIRVSGHAAPAPVVMVEGPAQPAGFPALPILQDPITVTETPTPTTGTEEPPAVSADWFAAVQEDIRRSEYQVTWQDQTYLADLPAAYQAPNRAHNLRTYFTPAGIRVISRTETAPTWEWGLSLTGYGYAGDVRSMPEAKLSAGGNRIEYRRGALTEWYVNDERGLEQGFTLDAPPVSLSLTPLILELALSGGLLASLVDDSSANSGQETVIEFTIPLSTSAGQDNGAPILYYGDLHAYDATGRELPAHIELVLSSGDTLSTPVEAAEPAFGTAIRLVVDGTDAVYPITVDPTTWTSESDQSGAWFGHSVSTAGDVNGDGYADVIVGAVYYDGGQTDEGRAYVYTGAANGLGTTADWTAESDQAYAYFGHSVSTAGDVNGDDYADIIVGAERYDHGQNNEGAAFVWHGSDTGLGSNGTPSNADWSAESNQSWAFFGLSVGTAGDVNGDGCTEVIVGASRYSNGEGNEGAAFVWYGCDDEDLGNNGTPTNADWTAEGDQDGAFFGHSVSTAGDVNGDGYADVVVGARYYTNGQSDEGRAYVYHGSASGLSTSADWTAESNQAYAQFGKSVSTAGDVNSDGYAEVIVGAHEYDGGHTNEGRAYVYHGSASGLSTSADWTAESNQSGAYFGFSVSTAGDVNGDGYADVVVGAYEYGNKGGVCVYYGSGNGLSSAEDKKASSDQTGAYFGYSVGTAGDVNGDGYTDIIVGAPKYDGGQTDEGRAYVYYGSVDSLSSSADWTDDGGQGSAYLGISVGTAGDVNGDGYADVIVGAYGYDSGNMDEGRAYVYTGTVDGLSTTADWTAESNKSYAYFGYSAGSAGDVDGDGYTDVIVGAYGYDGGQNNEGAVFVWHGSSTGLGSDGTPSNADWKAEGSYAGFLLGYSVGTAGDVNGDGYADVIAGARDYYAGQGDEGAAFAWYGSGDGLGDDGTPSNADWSAESNQQLAHFGTSVGTAGDVNGDGFSDVVIGAPDYDGSYSDEGRAYVYTGTASGLGTTADWTDEGGKSGAKFGYSVGTAGDVNGDGYADVVIGAPEYSSSVFHEDEGQAYVYHGSASGLGTTADWAKEANQSDVYLGYSVGTAGDVNGDGYADVIVGAPEYGNWDEGRAYVYLGSASGLGASPDWTGASDQSSVYFGKSVGTAGDVNGDGYADVVVGAPEYIDSYPDEGRAYLYYGNGRDGLDLLPRQMRTDGSAPIAPLGVSNSATAVQLRLTGWMPLGREDVKLQWQVAPLGTPFTASTIISGTSAEWTDVLTTGVVITQNVTGLSSDTAYHWRTRLLYRPNNWLGQYASRWFHVPWNGWTEQDFRTAEPIAGLSAANDSPTALGNATTLTATVSAGGSDVTYDWIFGDGDTGSGSVVAHTYPSLDTYTAVVTASDSINVLTATTTVVVTPTRVIRYTYDPLNRLTSADYSTGEYFAYEYDAMSNWQAMTETITSTVVTTYTYNAANQLTTARADTDGVTWYYTHDGRGNLTRQTPGGTAPAEGETRYTYNAAGQMVQVELYTEGDYVTLARAAYDGNGERVRLTTWADSEPMTVTFAVFQGQLLLADAVTQTTLYLYGWGLVAEYDGSEWSYHLRDGIASVRQVVDESGDVTLARVYKPFGGILQEQGLFETEFGFLGAQLDRISGLLYANGRYYDPVTGRFLTPNRIFDPFNPRTLNPYVPSPVLLLVVFAVITTLKKEWRKSYKHWMSLLLVTMLVTTTSCCPAPPPPSTPTGTPATGTPSPGPAGPTPAPTDTPPPAPGPGTPTPSECPPGGTPGAGTPGSGTPGSGTPGSGTPGSGTPGSGTPGSGTPGSGTPGSGTPGSTPTSTPTPTPTPSPWEIQYGQSIAAKALDLLYNADDYYIWGATGVPGHEGEKYTVPPPRAVPQPGSTWPSELGLINVYERTGGRMPIVCADVVYFSYKNAGLDLEQSEPMWFNSFNQNPTRNVGALLILIRDYYEVHEWGDGTTPELGDMVILKNYMHSAVIAEVNGSDPSQIFVIQASYTLGVINKMSLADWGLDVYYGHPF